MSGADYAEREIRRQVGQRLTEQQRAWLLKMPAWTAVRGEDIMRQVDALVVANVEQRAENQRLRDALILLADDAEAYLSLERDGQRNYPESLGLCIDEARLALIGTPSAAQTLEEPHPTKGTERS
jgi:hypothetical protein